MPSKDPLYVRCCSHYFKYILPFSYGYQQCTPHHTGGLIIANGWLLHYVFSGTGYLEKQGKIYHPKAGDMFVIRPGERYFYAADANDPWCYSWFNFECVIPLPAVLEQDIISHEAIGRVFQSTHDLAVQYPEEQLDSLLFGKLFELLGLLEALYPDTNNTSLGVQVHKALQFINQHYTEPITVEDIAAYVHLSSSTLITQFRKVTDTTPWQFLTNQRMRKAAWLLLTYDYPIGEIAEAVGYEDATSFTRTFRKHLGLSPTEYQRTYREMFKADRQKQ